MPDGSHDMYLGLGVLSRPVYEGAQKSRRAAMPVLQMEWSNGAFLAGMSAGWHLSERPNIEYGPLISLEPGRSSSGVLSSIDTPNTSMATFLNFESANRSGLNTLSTGDVASVTNTSADTFTITIAATVTAASASSATTTIQTVPAFSTNSGTGVAADAGDTNTSPNNTIKAVLKVQRMGLNKNNRLLGMTNVPARGLFGGFYNLQLAKNISLSNSFLYGAGEDRNGARLTTDLRYSTKDISPHHTVSLGVGINTMSQAYAMTYFGVSAKDALFSGNRPYTPSAGIKDVHANVNWNWNLNASWLLCSKINFSHLVGSAGASPLVERRSNFAVSSAIAYRF